MLSATKQWRWIFRVFALAKVSFFSLLSGENHGAQFALFVRSVAKRLLFRIPAGAPGVFLALLKLNGDGAFLGDVWLRHSSDLLG